MTCGVLKQKEDLHYKGIVKKKVEEEVRLAACKYTNLFRSDLIRLAWGKIEGWQLCETRVHKGVKGGENHSFRRRPRGSKPLEKPPIFSKPAWRGEKRNMYKKSRYNTSRISLYQRLSERPNRCRDPRRGKKRGSVTNCRTRRKIFHTGPQQVLLGDLCSGSAQMAGRGRSYFMGT